ncbi:RNA polymerase III transcription factor IIIC subunit-domain-containing protein [Panaeolus papilionaceus]|nr:RNA polymerase III transcription factor IIIC subunit-domain-containing protein [Panaeolus papilionaceus]
MERPPAAPEKPIPQQSFYSIEYPGYVKHASVPIAVNALGGQSKIDQAFKRVAGKTQPMLELSLRPGNPFAHPIMGEVSNSNNLVLKVVKRKRKKKNPDDPDVGEYTASIAGVMAKTVRFRAMADFQYLPDPEDPISQLRLAMDRMDVNYLASYTIPKQDSDVTNLDPQLETDASKALRLFPPPIFSRQTIPQGYNFKANTASIVSTTVDEETGEERKRMINRMRWKGYGPASIMFSEAQVPDKPPATVEAERDQVNQRILSRLNELFQERAIWTRMSLFNQFSAVDSRDILNSKLLLPLCCYVFQDGPWRDTLVRFSYDPRKDPSSRFYQRLYFRNANHPISRPSVTSRRQDRINVAEPQDSARKDSHIFDGKTLTKETAAFQLCDIVDPMLREMIHDPEGLREDCNERDGWYTAHKLDQIKAVLRYKFFSLLEGEVPTDEECRELISADGSGPSKPPTTHRSTKLRAGKHNMAKGALRPEDAAAMRLRATLDRNIKNFQPSR